MKMQQKSWLLDSCYLFFKLAAVWDLNWMKHRLNEIAVIFCLSPPRFACFCEFWESERMSRSQQRLLFRWQVRQMCRITRSTHTCSTPAIRENIVTNFSAQYPVFDGSIESVVLNNKTQQMWFNKLENSTLREQTSAQQPISPHSPTLSLLWYIHVYTRTS